MLPVESASPSAVFPSEDVGPYDPAKIHESLQACSSECYALLFENCTNLYSASGSQKLLHDNPQVNYPGCAILSIRLPEKSQS